LIASLTVELRFFGSRVEYPPMITDGFGEIEAFTGYDFILKGAVKY